MNVFEYFVLKKRLITLYYINFRKKIALLLGKGAISC